jgi:PAS domain S-box-containing protein
MSNPKLLPKATILIVDDRHANLLALESLLSSKDRTILTTDNGKEALKITLARNVDLIILDVQMPIMDGFEVAQILKSNKKTKDIPIIFASAEKTEHKSVMKGYEEGAMDYLHKPLDPDIAKAKVSALLQIHMQKKELAEKNASLEKSELLINNSADIIGIIDVETLKIEEINKAFTHILGYSNSEARGASLALFLSNEDRTKVQGISKQQKDQLAFETKVYCKDRSIKWLQWNVAVKNGKWFINARDITEIKEVEKIRNYLATFVKQTIDAIYICDTDGKIISWNSGAEAIYGYAEKEALNMKIWNIIPATAQKDGEDTIQKILQGKKVELLETHRITKHGKLIDAMFSASLIVDEATGIRSVAITERDITHQKKADEELRSSYQFITSVLENLPNMIFVKDAKELRFVRLNKAGEKLLGFSANDLMGKNDYNFFPKEQADFFTAKDRAVLEGEEVIDIPEEQIDTKNGKRWLHTRKIAIKDDDKRPVFLVGISEDITEKRVQEEKIKNLNIELSQKVRQLEAVNKELDAFSYSVSHDLRAPLRAINGYVKILVNEFKDKFEEDEMEMMEAVMNNTIKMGQLIDDLLAFSRIGKRELNLSMVDMTRIATTSLKNIKSTYNAPIKANISISPLLPCVADNNLMEIVFTNLISNAIKYSGKAERPVIEVTSFKENDENIYCVKDNGVGFDMKYYDKLFGVFQRLHSASEFDGTGVGLALVKRIVTRHGGRVWAEGEHGKGATFYVALYNKS